MSGSTQGLVAKVQLQYAHDNQEAQEHANDYYYYSAAAILLLLIINLLYRYEKKQWDEKNNRARQLHMGYDLGPDARDQHTERAPMPWYTRIIRAYLAFSSKYLGQVRLPWINLSLAELVIILSYIAFLIWCVLSDCSTIRPSSVLLHPIHSFANRAGLLAFASLPFNVLLSNKISLIGLLTGMPYNRLHFLHRWAGRCTLTLAVIHASTKLSEAHVFDKQTSEAYTFRNYGLAAFIIALTMLLLSQRWTVKYCYEVFVRLHNIMVFALIVLAWKHQPGHKHYLIASLLLWAFDRMYRFIRLIHSNGLWRKDGRRAAQSATLRLLSHDTTRLELCRADFAEWPPGSFAFISTPTMPTWWLPPQSHPFTIASRPSCARRVRATSISNYNSKDHDEANQASAPYGSGNSNDAMSQNQLVTSPANLIFLIRARQGWTKRLHELAQTTANPQIPVLIEGPYNSCPPLHVGFDTVILFAGGAGLSWTLPLLVDLVEKGRNGQSAVRQITWVCVLRHYVNYDWFYNELESLDAVPGVDIRVHFTTDAMDANLIPQHYHPGRPNIQTIIEKAVESSLGRVFVGVAGPLGPSDEVRRQARKVISPMAILRGDPRGDVHFHSELFGW